MVDRIIPFVEVVASYSGFWWAPLIILFFMTVESSFVPFPSEVVMIPAGFLAARGDLFPGSPLTAATIAVIAGLTGSLAGAYINYYLSLRLGRPFLHRYGRYFFLKPAALDRAEEIFREYGEVATFVCRLLPAIRQLISIPAGISRMHFGRFSFFTGLGAGIWVIVLTVMGYVFGKQSADMSYADLVHHSKDLIKDNLVWILLGCGVLFGGYVYVHKKVMHGRKTPPASA